MLFKFSLTQLSANEETMSDIGNCSKQNYSAVQICRKEMTGDEVNYLKMQRARQLKNIFVLFC